MNPSSWKIEWSSRAAKFVERLGKGIRQAIDTKVWTLRERPKQGKYFANHDLYALRITTPGGEYRALYRLEPEDQTILVVLVGPRETIYDLLNR